MKIYSNKADIFLSTIPETIFGVLLYGPNQGLVALRSKNLKSIWIGNHYDPFDLVQLEGLEIIKDNSIFLNHICSLSLGGNRQVIIINNPTDKLTKLLKEIDFNLYKDKKIILLCDELNPRSSLRKFFEDDKLLAAVPCYEDTLSESIGFIKNIFSDHNLNVPNSLIHEIANYLSGDRLINYQEITKLLTYANGELSNINSDTLRYILSNNNNFSIENISYAVCSGQKLIIVQNIQSAFRVGISPISILRGTIFHFERILFIKQHNSSLSTSMNMLKPKIFFKRESEFINQVNNWSINFIILSLKNLLVTELMCKKHHHTANILCERSLLSVASRFGKK